MGNYIQSFHVPPPEPGEREQDHPLYYDWSVPKFNPFLEDSKKDSKTEPMMPEVAAKSTTPPSSPAAIKSPSPPATATTKEVANKDASKDVASKSESGGVATRSPSSGPASKVKSTSARTAAKGGEHEKDKSVANNSPENTTPPQVDNARKTVSSRKTDGSKFKDKLTSPIDKNAKGPKST